MGGVRPSYVRLASPRVTVMIWVWELHTKPPTDGCKEDTGHPMLSLERVCACVQHECVQVGMHRVRTCAHGSDPETRTVIW